MYVNVSNHYNQTGVQDPTEFVIQIAKTMMPMMQVAKTIMHIRCLHNGEACASGWDCRSMLGRYAVPGGEEGTD